ncbi:MAG: T9SS type A sorting domain-containing protein [Balneolales bacterium]
MKTKNTYKQISSACTALVMLLIVASGFQNANAQERITVEPDDFPMSIGALNRAIDDNGGDVIYVLKNGATYFLDSELSPSHALHIEAEEYPSNNPPIIRPGTDTHFNSQRISTYQNDVIARGIFFFALDDVGGDTQSQRTSSEGISLLYQHCYFMSGNNYFWWLGANDTKLRIEDTQLANAGRSSSAANQRFIDMRGNDTDSVSVINSSIYNLNAHLFRTGGALLNYLMFDHVTVVNNSTRSGSFNLRIVKDATIKNSLFRNDRLNGNWESAELVGDAGPGYDGEAYVSQGGLIYLQSYDELWPDSSITDADRNIVIKNNNFGGLPDQEYLDLWADREAEGDHYVTDPQWSWDNPNIGSDDPEWATRDTILATLIHRNALDSTARAWADQNVSWATIENNIEERVEIEDMPESMADYLRAHDFGEEIPSHEDRWDDITADENNRYFHPAPGTPTDEEQTTAAWFRDLSYNTDSQSYKHAEDYYPVGNLNFFPELRSAWEEGIVQEPVSAENERTLAKDFRIVGNYPNPFNPTTNIVYDLASQTEVTMDVFNVLGQNVETMHLGVQTAGRHEVTFDAANLSSGMYMVRMQMGNEVQTLRMTLIK